LSTNSNTNNKSPQSPIIASNFSNTSSSPNLEKLGNTSFTDINNNTNSSGGIDSSFEFDPNVYKRSISDNGPKSLVSLEKSKEKELKETIQAVFYNNNTNSSIGSPFSPKSSTTHRLTKSKFNNNDDIILRALLKTSDLEPQLLKLESVFDMNKKNPSLSRHNSEASNEPNMVSLNSNVLRLADEEVVNNNNNKKAKYLKNNGMAGRKATKSKKLSSSSDQNAEFLTNSQVKGAMGRKIKKKEELNIKSEPYDNDEHLSANTTQTSSKKRTASINELNSNTGELVNVKYIKKEKQERTVPLVTPVNSNRKVFNQEDIKLAQSSQQQANFNSQKPLASMTSREKLSSSSSSASSASSTLSPVNSNTSLTNSLSLKLTATTLNASTSNQMLPAQKKKSKATPPFNISLTEDEDMINQLEQVFSTQNSNFSELENEFEINENLSALTTKSMTKSNAQANELDLFQNNNLQTYENNTNLANASSSSSLYNINNNSSNAKINELNSVSSEQKLNLMPGQLNSYQPFHSPAAAPSSSESPLITTASNSNNKSLNEVSENSTNNKLLTNGPNVNLNSSSSSQKTVTISPFKSNTNSNMSVNANSLSKSRNNSGIYFFKLISIHDLM
jgi:hypothetical protein